MKITVLGWYNHDNIGDEAYKLAFPRLFPQHQFTFVDKLPPNQSEPVILGGGNIILEPFLTCLRRSVTRPDAMSVDVSNKYQEDACQAFRHVLRRNKPSLSVGTYVPDFAFALTGDENRGRELIKRLFQGQELYQKVVVVVLNGYLCVGEGRLARDHNTFQKVTDELASIMDTTSASFLLLPFGNGFPHNDRIANSVLYGKCKFWKKNTVVYEKLSVQDTLDVVTAADALISSRLHASIFSCIGGTPWLDLIHHDKNRGFLETVERQDWGLDYWHLDFHRAKEMLTGFLSDEAHGEKIRSVGVKNRDFLVDFVRQITF